MALKSKKILSRLLRIAMRNTEKPSHGADTVQINAGDSQISITGFESLNSMPETLLSLCSSTEKERNDKKLFSKIRLGNSESRIKRESRDRMQKDHDKKQSQVMKKFAEGYARKFGTEAMFAVLARMGKEAESALDYIEKAIEYLKEMKQRGITIGTGTYGPLLQFLVDMGLVEKFRISKDVIRKSNPDALVKIGYYEMLLWIQVKDEAKIHEICSYIEDNGNSLSNLQEYYMIALCEKVRKENLQRLLEIVDVTNLSSALLLTNIFGYLGRFLLESIAMKFFEELKKYGKDEGKKASNLIFNYASCIPNSTVEDSVLKFNKLHEELDIMPSPSSYDTHYLSLRLK